MKQYYYSTQPFISWVINKYFYYGVHYTYVAPFYPYRLPNPKSSNPYLIYNDLYLPWKDNDIYDKTIAQSRINLRKGVMIRENNGDISSSKAADLKELCDKISLKFFIPIVYRVDIANLGYKLSKSGSGLIGSDEYLIADLSETEFDILFFDETSSYSSLNELMEKQDTLTEDEVLTSLKDNYVDSI